MSPFTAGCVHSCSTPAPTPPPPPKRKCLRGAGAVGREDWSYRKLKPLKSAPSTCGWCLVPRSDVPMSFFPPVPFPQQNWDWLSVTPWGSETAVGVSPDSGSGSGAGLSPERSETREAATPLDSLRPPRAPSRTASPFLAGDERNLAFRTWAVRLSCFGIGVYRAALLN